MPSAHAEPCGHLRVRVLLLRMLVIIKCRHHHQFVARGDLEFASEAADPGGHTQSWRRGDLEGVDRGNVHLVSHGHFRASAERELLLLRLLGEESRRRAESGRRPVERGAGGVECHELGWVPVRHSQCWDLERMTTSR